ncbi:MAG TPA: hypothetical protein VFT95_03655 [Micromonosporaceae bacterium]|nr:hypothetical protein [Micromonosporaceae bacterium]
MSNNPEVRTTLDDAVAEVLSTLTGLDLTYDPELDRYRSITRALNRALRANALDNEWSWYASTASVGPAGCGETIVPLPPSLRPRIINDDAVRLVDADGHVQEWAYFLPRDALHKYGGMNGLWCSVTQQSLMFSRKFTSAEAGLDVVVPIMREPVMFRLPAAGRPVSTAIRRQLIDFPYPDVIVARAAYFYAQTDPVMQPRAQTLEGGYKDLMYQLIERDTSISDTPYMNSFTLPLENGLVPVGEVHRHPHSDF